MAYVAIVSLANTIDRFLNHNLFSISLEEEQQILSLLEYVTLFQDFVEKFPEKFKSLEERMREVATAAEDILEYLVLEKVFLPCDDESESHPSRDLEIVMKETHLQLGKVMEFLEDIPDEAKANSLVGRFMKVVKDAGDFNRFLRWEKDHSRFRDKWRFLPAEFAKFKSKLQIIHHLNKTRNEINSIMEEVMTIKNYGDAGAATSSSKLVLIDDLVDFHNDDESKCHRSVKHELQLEKVMEEIALVAAEMKELIKDSSSSKQVQPAGTHSSASSSSSTATSTQTNSMVGFEDHAMNIKYCLCGESPKLQIIPICGMGGIGKTTLARSLYDDPLIVYHFDVRVWVTISQEFSAQRILSSILNSLKEYNTDRLLGKSDDEKVHKILMGRRYLVVMDDIWSGEAWDIVRRVLPDDGNGSRVLLTTRLSRVATYPNPTTKLHEIGLLNEDQSWNLFKQKVFADEDCPSGLKNIGKDIVRSCKGLPLAIVVIAGLLSTIGKNPTSWQEIAESVKSAHTTEHDQIEEILSLSYIQLPQYLRPCFLYMGSFQEDEEIHVKKLIRLWVAEAFLSSCPTNSKTLEKIGEECLEELVKRNLVLVTEWKWDGRIKSCSLHDLVRDLCIKKSHESKFFLNMMDMHIEKEDFIENMKIHRRVSVDSSYLSYLSRCDDSTIHSIKCSKKYHLLTPKFLNIVRLLRVLDAESIDGNYSPSMDQLYELFHLRYLAIRYAHHSSGQLSLNFQNLETLIIRYEKLDKSFVGLSYTLRLGWYMPQLRHVYFYGVISFDDPGETTCPLENLQTLSYVEQWSCNERILKLLPNLKELKVDCSYREGEVCLYGLEHLHRLENLEIYAGRMFLSPPKYYKVNFPTMLKKLILQKLELPWNDITHVGSLPCLQVLKLKFCTCVGGTWKTIEGAFPVLEVLEISDSTLENWITESSHFPRLKRLLIHSCWDLNGIPSDIGDIPTLQLIEVKGGVKKSLVESVELIQQEQEDLDNDTLEVVCSDKFPEVKIRFW